MLLELVDRGTGMSEEVLANALLPFYSTKASGTGLGLTLCREIVEAHGGTLDVGNRARRRCKRACLAAERMTDHLR